MKSPLRLALSLLPLLVAALPQAAQADIYKCADGDGRVTFTNANRGKNCTRLALDPVSTVPAVRGGGGGGARPSTSPDSFPKVDGDTQRARDTDRRRILDQELDAEQKMLEEARKQLAEQEARVLPEERNAGGGINGAKVQERLQPFRDKVGLHERNIQALNKELGGR